ncbi:EamA family transporter [Sulfitobacter sp. JBTF-M27]|uniref:EamA family transporter n=1 Tax=Sulfitobacter sediminilitoris TaxID=2698830 RepID=A0A6P0C512_9RHOB|nr:DMT family transporter [Sulfitobacter sediminilitoris]NEK21241.1 EamA family transporter [Sulfitobacter sediminilitoris]
MDHDRPIFGIALMLGFCIVAPIGDAVAKLLGTSVPIGEVVLVRFGLQALMLFPLVWISGRIWRMRGRIVWLTLLRTLLHIIGIAAMFTALRYLPLADAIAIAFVMPFFMLLLGRFVLHEEVGLRRLVACLVGFFGTLLVIQPSFATVGWPALLPVFVAINFSVFMLITRQIAKETDPIGLQAVSGVMAVALILPLLLLGSLWKLKPLEMIAPDAKEWTLLMAIGVLGTVAHLLMTWALRFAPSATLAPMQYLEIPFATILGLVIFQDLPDPLATAGIAVIMAAGLYIIMRERATAQHLAAKTAEPAPA